MTKGKELQTNTVSSRFTDMVVKEFSSTSGLVEFNPYKKKLTQHMFVKIDAQLKDLEAKRAKDNRQVATYEWKNINLEKLAIDTVHRVDLGIDALIPNHISPIPYFNKKKEKYDLDLRIGFEGKDYYRRKMARDEPINIIYELVYSNDTFVPHKRSMNQDYETYEFKIEPFDRGNIVGGFAYVVYAEKEKNTLVIVSEKEFVKSKNFAKQKDFWDKHPEKMRMKTLVHRATETLKLDPEKINASFLVVENEAEYDQEPVEVEVHEEIKQNANSEVIDIPQAEDSAEDTPLTEAEKEEIEQMEIAEATRQNQPDF